MHLDEFSWASWWNLIELQWNPNAISIESQWNQSEPQWNFSEIWMHPQAGYDVLLIFAPRVTAWRSSGCGIIQDTHTHSHKNEKQIEEGKERKVSSKVCPLGFSPPPALIFEFFLVSFHLSLYLLPGSILAVHSTQNAWPYFMAVTQLSQRFLNHFCWNIWHAHLGKREPPKNTNQLRWHAPPKLTPISKIDMLQVLWCRACNVTNSLVNHAWETKDLCVHVLRLHLSH